jgi:hypothetical protein
MSGDSRGPFFTWGSRSPFVRYLLQAWVRHGSGMGQAWGLLRMRR